MSISEHIMFDAQAKFERLLQLAGPVKREEILTKLSCAKQNYSRDVIDAVVWLYANSPLSDMANYDFSLFLSFAVHGVFLRENSPYASNIPEDIFLNFVLHSRMGGEEICDCRKFFYDKLTDRIKGLSMHDAIIEINYFNAENVKYISTDYRTLSAIGTYNSTFGRCGEEAVFAVNVFRALGIPSRQVYTPRWSHCDDNHAWVEVWCDGGWHFLGACEPEEVLDKGWFTNASTRAMIIGTTSFGQIKDAELLFKSGLASVINVLDTYAPTKKITVIVKDASGRPEEGARVSFGILNHSHIFPCAVMTTDADGKAELTCGYGSLCVRISKGDIYFERMVYTPSADTFEFVLKLENLVYDRWEDFVSIAPSDGIPKGVRPTPKQKEIGKAKTAAANLKREKRVEAMFDSARAQAVIKKFGYSDKIKDIIKESYGNAENIYSFLENEKFSSKQKERILLSLSEKDWRDINIDVLNEALEYSENLCGDKALFYDCVVCPRIWFETLEPNRKFINDYFSKEEKQSFVKDPKTIWKFVCDSLDFEPQVEYSQIVTRPVGALTTKKANQISRKILFVAICRALNIPARLNPITLLAEYYDKSFVSVEKPQEAEDSIIIFEKDEGESYAYLSDFALGMLENGNYSTLDLEGEKWDGNTMKVAVKSGEYRVITDNRLPNGNLYASKYHLKLGPKEVKTVKLHKHPANLSEMLFDYTVDDFKVEYNGKLIDGSKLSDNSVLMWLDEGAEPTEHILNEMLENESEFKSLPSDIIFMVRSQDSLSNAKLKKVLDTFPKIKVCFDSFDPNVEVLARRLFLDPEKLPLIIIFKSPLKATYACSGYNVGSGKMILKVCEFLNKK